MICSLCGWDMGKVFSGDISQEARLCKIAVASLVLGILSIFTLLVTAIPAAILGFMGLRRIRKNPNDLKGEGFAIAGIIAPVFAATVCLPIAIVLWKCDAPAIPNDYTIADLRTPSAEGAESYELLISLLDGEDEPNGAPAIGLTEDDLQIIEETFELINNASCTDTLVTKEILARQTALLQAWRKCSRARDTIKRLSRSSEIADLTEPSMSRNKISTVNWRHLSRLYSANVCLQSLRGDVEQAVKELIEFDAVFRKFGPNVGTVLAKFVCYGVYSTDLSTINWILNRPQTSDRAMKLIAEHFVAFSDEQMSLRKPMIGEYLMFQKSICEDIYESLAVDEAVRDKPKSNPLFKTNSTLRLYRNYCDYHISLDAGEQMQQRQELSVWPKAYLGLLPDVRVDHERQVPLYYTWYNPIGTMMSTLMAPGGLKSVFNIKTRIHVIDDLFQIVLGLRMGREVSLKARAYGDEYIIDVDKAIIYSPGPDEQAFTKDDIKLPLNPEVLGIGN